MPGGRSCSSTRPGTSCAGAKPATTPTTSRCAPATSGSCSPSSSNSSPRPTPNTASRCCRTPPCNCCSPNTPASWPSCNPRSSSPPKNPTIQILLPKTPRELAFMHPPLKLSDENRDLLARLKTVKGSHAQMLWINGTRGRGRVSARVGPLEYWAFTSDQGRDTPRRQAALRDHDGDAWAAITDLARTTATRAAL